MTRLVFVPLAFLPLLAFGARGTLPPSSGAPTASEMVDRLPLRFEPNQGQLPPEIRFLSRSSERLLLLTGTEAIVALRQGALRIRPLKGNRAPALEGIQQLPSRSNYLLGQDRSKWRENVHNFGGVRYRGVYPGIDLVYRGSGRQVEYDFFIAPGADPRRIRLKFDGADRLSLDKDGALVVRARGEELRQPVPFAFQDKQGATRARVEVGYRLLGRNEVGFTVGDYDRAETLVIDPVLVATYFGGSSFDVATNVGVDSTGAVWVVGHTSSPSIPISGGYREGPAGNIDLFVAKFNRSLTGAASLEFATYMGGDGEDKPSAISIEGAFIFITGSTTSSNFPIVPFASQRSISGDRDAFLLRLGLQNRGLDILWYGSYFGGPQREYGTAVSAESDGRVFMAGYTTTNENFPLTGTPMQGANRGGYEAFITHYDTNNQSGPLLYSSFLGGSSTDVPTGLAADRAGAVYMTGYTMSDNFPVTEGAYKTQYGGRGDLFIAKIDRNRSGLDALAYATYIGGSDTDLAYSLARDQRGRLYLTGYTISPDFPASETALQRTNAGLADAFLIRVDPSLPAAQSLTYATYFGGTGDDLGYGIAVDSAGRVALTGYTFSTDLPVRGGALQGANAGASDAFLALVDLSSAPGTLSYASYVGGASVDIGNKVAMDDAGNAYLVGSTTSRAIASSDGVFQPDLSGLTDGFLVRFNLCPDAAACAAEGLTVRNACVGQPSLPSLREVAEAGGCTTDGRGGILCTHTACNQ